MTIRVVLGLGFGDEGKGTVVDWLARRGPPPTIVRWNGGPQAAHHVVTTDRRAHCFAQLGSGSFVDGARTHLGPDMAIDPYALLSEASLLAGTGVAGVLSRLTIDPRAVLVTPWHAIVNQVRELLRGPGRHGSTGRGVGEAKLGGVRVLVRQLAETQFTTDIERLRAGLHATAAALVAAHADPPAAAVALVARALDRDLVDAFLEAAHQLGPSGVVITPTPPLNEHIIFESAQGALLDRDHGFFPHVTPSRITRRAAEDACRSMNLEGPLEVWGVLRAVHTRHGEGPFPSEDAALTAELPELYNRNDDVAGPFRVGWFDGVLARYAIGFAGPIDRLVVTCLDRVEGRAAVVPSWNAGAITDLAAIPEAERAAVAASARGDVTPVASMVDAIEQLVQRPVDLESWGPTAADKRPRQRGARA